MQEIAFSIPDSATGAGKIYVNVNGVNSNELNFTVRNGTNDKILWIKTTGSDSSSNGSWANPYRTTRYVFSGDNLRLQPGAIVYGCNGLVADDKRTDTGLCPRWIYGTASQPVAFVAYPGATVTCSGTGHGAWIYETTNFTLSKLNLASNDACAESVGAGTRVVGCSCTDITCADGQAGALVYSVQGHPSDNKYLGNYIHDWGCSTTGSLHHTMYFTNRSTSSITCYDITGTELGWNYLNNNMARFAFHFYGEGDACGWSTPNLIHDNVVKDQVYSAVNIGGTTTRTGFGGDWDVYNNLFINCGIAQPDGDQGGVVIQMSSGNNTLTGNADFYNNIIYGYANGAYPAEPCAAMLWNYGAEHFTYNWINNIVVDNANRPYTAEGMGGVFNTWKNPASSHHNIWYNGGDGNPANPPSWDTSPLSSNPLFINPAANDFHLQSNSPALDKGSSTVSSVVKRDLEGNMRPMDGNNDGSALYDMGAFEYSGPMIVDTTPPSAPTGASICGDNIKGPPEECDGTDDDACPGRCNMNRNDDIPNCTCE